MTIRFVLCVEAGRLEGEALLFCQSVRRFAGSFAESPISAYRPREGDRLAAETYAALADLGVEVVEEPLNTEHAYYPMANKVHAAAHAEDTAAEDVIALCDSDAVILGEPSELDLAEGIDAAVSPVGKVGLGSTGPGHEHEPYWERLYELAAATERPWTLTALDGERIRAYWNAGLVAARRNSCVMADWLDVLALLVREEHFPRRGISNLDQMALAGALARRGRQVSTLPVTYNHRITRRELLPDGVSELDLADLVHVHYMRAFHVRGFLQQLDPPLDRDSEEYQWLAERLPLEPEIEVPLAEGETLSWKKIRRAAGGQLKRRAYRAPLDP